MQPVAIGVVSSLSGFLIGILVALLLARHLLARELYVLRKKVTSLSELPGKRDAAAAEGDGKATHVGNRASTASSFVGSEASGDVSFLNKALEATWPFVSQYCERILREEVEPALQRSVPEMFSGIHFGKCHLGQSPIRVKRVMAASEERQTSSRDTVTNVRFVGEVMLDGDCEIELHVPHSIRSTTVGISNLKLFGKAVFEMFQLLPKPPFVSGGVVYFTNPPALDLTMIGDFAGLLNLGFVKQKIIDVITQQLGRKIVLPKRYVRPLNSDVDIFELTSPQPEGILRVAVMETRGLREPGLVTAGRTVSDALERATGLRLGRSSMNPYVRVIFGDVDWRTKAKPGSANPLWQEDNVVDLTVHDRYAQQLSIAVYNEEHSLIWGVAQGQCFGKCSVGVETLIMQTEDKWWPLVTDELVSESSKDLSASGKRVMFASIRFSTTTALNSNGLSSDGVFIRLCAEWRPFNTDWRQAQALLDGRSLHRGWKLQSGSSGRISQSQRVIRVPGAVNDVTCKLLVGVHSANGLPSHRGMYRCTVACASAAKSAHATDEARTQKTSQYTQGIRRTKTRYYGRGRELALGHEASDVSSVEAIWERPFFFHLRVPGDAVVSITVQEQQKDDAKREHKRAPTHKTLGTMSYAVANLLSRENLEDVLEAPLEFDFDESTKCGVDDLPPPCVQLALRLWLLGPPYSEVAEGADDTDIMRTVTV
mmetsp:Transcript_83902/g.237707  ORF Transcript_83902/g.237707 Transcript_83902/m.237707 type:complete len:710 (+) Transcript_83902:147-2276(+)